MRKNHIRMNDSQEIEPVIFSTLTKKQFSDFFKKNYHVACLISLKYISDPDQAEDLVQDVFVTLWDKRDTLRIKTNLKHFFFTAVKNHTINFIRRNKANPVPLSEMLNDLSVEENQESFDDEELAVKIAYAIEELPPCCKKIFCLAYRDKLTYDQIAIKLNITKNTVKTQMGIAYRQLRGKLQKYIIILFGINFH